MPGHASETRHASQEPRAARLWVERLRLTDFRNYASLALDLDARPVALTGPNGAGKTNLLEAVSLLAPGQGLRGVPYAELTRAGARRGWAAAARLQGLRGPVEIGTGLSPGEEGRPAGRVVRIDGEAAGPAALAAHAQLVWLIPAMDGLFAGPAAERRRFLARLVYSLHPGHRAIAARFERALRQRNRLLEIGAHEPAQFHALEAQLAATGAAIAAARLDLVSRLEARIAARRAEAGDGPFPWAMLTLRGLLEERLGAAPALEVEDAYRAHLAQTRARDRAARRTLDGPHRADLVVTHGPKGLPAHKCSTGEQKALLVGLVLAHAALVAQSCGGAAPLLLLDEIAAHLDAGRREALFTEVADLGAQAWMTGTDAAIFAPLGAAVQSLALDDGTVRGGA